MIKNIIFIIYLLTVITLYASDNSDVFPSRKVVYVNMVADLFHSGHVSFLKKAREFGNYLIAGIHNDELVVSYKRRPITTMEERVSVVQECRYVDEVISNSPIYITKDFIEQHNIDVVVHGDDFDNEKINKYYGEIQQLGKLKLVQYTPNISTTDIIDRIEKRSWHNILHSTITDLKVIFNNFFDQQYSVLTSNHN